MSQSEAKFSICSIYSSIMLMTLAFQHSHIFQFKLILKTHEIAFMPSSPFYRLLLSIFKFVNYRGNEILSVLLHETLLLMINGSKGSLLLLLTKKFYAYHTY